MRLLILGGTAFLSATVARQALAQGHDVTCLARGSSQRPPEGVRWVAADRDLGAAAYEAVSKGSGNGDWDAVIDVARQPALVRDALTALADRAAHWTLVSTCSVYADHSVPGADESAALLPPLPVAAVAELETYGEGKVTCENLVLEAIGDRAHISRAGLIVGTDDPSDRFGYWPARFARVGDDRVLVPATLDAVTQIIGVDDLAAWLLTAAAAGTSGVFNAVGDTTRLGALLDQVQQVAGHSGEQVPVDHDWLLEQKVNVWSGPDSLPLWLPTDDHAGFGARTNQAAKDAGMVLSPTEAVIAQTLAYERSLGLGRERKAGLPPQREAELLAAWDLKTS